MEKTTQNILIAAGAITLLAILTKKWWLPAKGKLVPTNISYAGKNVHVDVFYGGKKIGSEVFYFNDLSGAQKKSEKLMILKGLKILHAGSKPIYVSGVVVDGEGLGVIMYGKDKDTLKVFDGITVNFAENSSMQFIEKFSAKTITEMNNALNL